MSFAERSLDGGHHHVPAAVDAVGNVFNAGFDRIESVQKVAMMVWNSSLLQWERSTGAGGSSGGGSVVVTKRIEIVSDALIYKGEAEPGTAEGTALWSIRKLTFDVSGNPTAELFGVGAWTNRASVTYQ
jgi:hypothetical protein